MRALFVERCATRVANFDDGCSVRQFLLCHRGANNGTAITTGSGAVVLNQLSSALVRFEVRADSVAIDAGGRTALWPGAGTALTVLDVQTSAVRQLPVGQIVYAPALSDDRSRILFLGANSAEGLRRVFIVQTDGTGLRQITSESKGLKEAVLSGDGRIIWATTTDGALIQFEIPTGQRRVMIAPTFDLPDATPYIVDEVKQGARSIVAAHQNFEGLVTESSPARPGEIIHMWGTGFGPVSPAVSDGVTPLAPLSYLASPLRCQYHAGVVSRRPLDVMFAGLAPGMIGVYQISVRIPVDVAGDSFSFDCGGTVNGRIPL